MTTIYMETLKIQINYKKLDNCEGNITYYEYTINHIHYMTTKNDGAPV